MEDTHLESVSIARVSKGCEFSEGQSVSTSEDVTGIARSLKSGWISLLAENSQDLLILRWTSDYQTLEIVFLERIEFVQLN